MKAKFMPSEVAKRCLDFSVSALILAGLSPLLFLTVLGIRMTSKGPVIYKQERLGKNRTPFVMYKFRTMVENAEDKGPQLAMKDDKRVTGFGKILRKYHIDEITQFWNVIKGEMSIVGPRPEREIYIREIEEKFPEYSRIFDVKPGITSLGMVKYGYASDIDQMIQRAKHDLEYLENPGFSTKTFIIAETLKTVLRGKGI